MRLKLLFLLAIFVFLFSCDNSKTKSDLTLSADTLVTNKDTISKIEVIIPKDTLQINDTLNALVNFISGNNDQNPKYQSLAKLQDYKNYSYNFNKRWHSFDSSRITQLKSFRENVFAKEIKYESTLLYPFSGPDILYANIFFPDVENYIMIGLEPVGTLPQFKETDSLKTYFNKLNSSLHAILKFSFFRTISMKSDLRNAKVDGTLHLLLLFLNRLGHPIISATPITVDSIGKVVNMASFEALKKANVKTKGIEITFLANNSVKKISYFSLNIANEGLKKNKGFFSYLMNLKKFNTYLKGASYLLHESNFSEIRNVILNGSSSVIQDDSGIALRYFKTNEKKWTFQLFGNYTRPISIFGKYYQRDLDSLYNAQTITPVGFGIGYNFKDKNSNLMVAKSN